MAAPCSRWRPAALSLLFGCGDPPVEPAQACAHARVLEVPASVIARSGRTLDVAGGWAVGTIAEDGTHTLDLELDIELVGLARFVAFDHDPQSGRMWVATWSFDETEEAWLFQFDARGQLEWSERLDALGPVQHVSLRHHEGALYVATRASASEGELPSLRVERRDAAGATQWLRDDLLDPFAGPLAHAELRGVAEGALAMLATPPLIDYGPSYPLTLDLASGATIWLDAQGHSAIALATTDDRVHVAWSANARLDDEAWLAGEHVELEPARSTLRSSTPSGTMLAEVEVAWPERFGESQQQLDIEVALLGDHIASLVQGSGGLGLTLHSREGALLCQEVLDVPILGMLGPAHPLEGREQIAIVVEYARLDDIADLGILLLDPLE